MKESRTKKSTKQIICIIIILMLCNFILPNYSYAVSPEGGGSLANVIGQFLCFIPDAIIGCLQDMLISPQGIKVGEGKYEILYSPGTIFSGEIPAFDINFITPQDSKTGTETITQYVSLIDALDLNDAKFVTEIKYSGGWAGIWKTKNGAIKDIKNNTKYEYDPNREIDISILEGKLQSIESELTSWFAGSTWNGTDNTLKCAWYNADQTKVYIIVDYYHLKTDNQGNITYKDGRIMLYEIDSRDALENATDITDTTTTVVKTTKEYNSSAAILQKVVATWYNALRRIALVGLLSVLLYIGIKILLSSTSAKDKAKYKNMLKDWLIALCMLFVLHYIMSITITIVDKINEVIKASSIGANGEDILMSSVRSTIATGDNGWGGAITYVVIYFVLAIYTIIFTFQYFKRVIYIAFLTAIAPLITLTYPLDKIKDSTAQAFDMWIKDYIFFSLLQVLHLLIYYVFLGSSMDLARHGNWIYAIVAIGFITKAEKIMKKMFGFEKSKTMGALTAGATGALLMNAINELSHKAPNGKKAEATSGASSKNNNVRTAISNPLYSLQGNNGEMLDTPTPRGSNPSSSSNSARQTSRGSSPSSSSNSAGQTSRKLSPSVQSNSGGTNKNATIGQGKTGEFEGIKRALKGAKSVVGKYYKPVSGFALGVGTSLTGVILGTAYGVTKGEIGEVLSGAITGGALGYSLGQKAVNIVPNAIDGIKQTSQDIADTFREGTHGEEYVKNQKISREFKNSSTYQELKKSDKDIDDKVEQILDAEITDTNRIAKILKNNKKHPRKYSMDKAIKFSKLAKKCPEEILYDNSKFIRFCHVNGIDISEEELEEIRKCIIDFK